MNKRLCTLTTLLTVVLNSFGQYSKEFQTIVDYKSCRTLIDTVAKNWVLKENKKYYESNFTLKDTVSKEIILPCIRGVKRDDIKILFGAPSAESKNIWKYYTSPIDNNGFVESYLLIEFQNNRLTKITENNCAGTLQYINKNWKYAKARNYYKTSFTPDRQGIKKIEISCISKLDRHVFQNIFGEPHLAFKSKITTPMQKREWDDEGNEIQPELIDNQNIIYRYYTSRSPREYENNIMEVTFYPANIYREAINRIETKNCQNIIDTIKARLSYIDSLDHYQYKSENKFLNDVRLYSTCLYGMDTAAVIPIFGRPSVINKERVWEYHTNDTNYDGQYRGNGMKLYFYENGTLSNIEFIWEIPIINKD